MYYVNNNKYEMDTFKKDFYVYKVNSYKTGLNVYSIMLHCFLKYFGS